MSELQQPSSTASGVAWDLRDLYQNVDDPNIERDLATALQRAEAFAHSYRGKIESLTATDASLLLQAVIELDSLSELMDRPAIYAMLAHSAQTEEPRHGALLSRTREQRMAINKHLIFFDLEWIQLADNVAQALIADNRLERYRHFLEVKRLWKPHYLSEPEEKLLDEKAITGRSAFARLFEETAASLKFPFPPSPGARYSEPRGSLSLQEILAKLYDPDREVRRLAAESISATLKDNARLLTFIFNTIVLDHSSDTQLRHFPSPMASRHLANETTDRVVDALMTAAEKHYELVRRYYRLKGKLLKLDRLYDYDRYAPLWSDPPRCDWDTARRIVRESYEGFSPRAGAIIGEFFDKRWIDAELRPGKRSGAFASSAVPSVHPYILLNFTDRIRDVMTLAHELGHGLHQYLARAQGYLQCDTPLTTAETASVFGEMLTFQRLLAVYPEPKVRLAMLCGKIEDSFATVFRQVVLTRFELDLHRARAEQGELSPDAVSALWLDANRKMFGDVVELTDGYALVVVVHRPFHSFPVLLLRLRIRRTSGAGPVSEIQARRSRVRATLSRFAGLGRLGGPSCAAAQAGRGRERSGLLGTGTELLGDMVSEAEELAKSVANS